MKKTARQTLLAVFFAASAFLVPAAADAFCGFYVSGAESSLYNDATMVSLLRDGERTVMSMRNEYEGPPDDFAMVVPVPEVLDKERVTTLEDGVFERLDGLTAPRLVKYWERDPCWREKRKGGGGSRYYDFSGSQIQGEMKRPDGVNHGVKVEAEFKEGEYDVVILSAEESNGLETWLREHDYNIPDGGAEHFQPYVQQGQYFFVAKVDADRVEFEKGPQGKKRAVLSPLRFYYDRKDFNLPIRLGLINSKGRQDLVAILLSKEGRYEVANRRNVTMPTNLRVDEEVEGRFASFYDRLLTETIDRATPDGGADAAAPVVTEYAWSAGKCDPCPRDPMSRSDLVSLGGDALVEREMDSEIDRSAWMRLPEPVREADGPVVGLGGRGEISRTHAEMVAEDLWPTVKSCVVGSGRKGVGGRPGKLVGVVRIGAKSRGKPVDVRVPHNDLGDFASACVQKALLKARYPWPAGGDAILRLTFPVSPELYREKIKEEHFKSMRPDRWTVTRLHTRYGPKSLDSELVFRQAPAIRGGTGEPRGVDGEMSGQRAETTSSFSRYQSRYVILNPWEDESTCDNPKPGTWDSKPPPDKSADESVRTSGSSVGAETGREESEGGEDDEDVDLEEWVDEGRIPFQGDGADESDDSDDGSGGDE